MVKTTVNNYFMRKAMTKDRKRLIKIRISAPSLAKCRDLLMLVFLLSTSSFSVANEVLPLSKARQHAADIQHYVDEAQIQFLQANDEEFVALFREQTTGMSKGTAIIVPDLEQSIYHQAAISGLYEKLNHYGWNSLLLTMPDELSPILDSTSVDDAAPQEAEQENANVAIGTVNEDNPDAEDSLQTDGSDPNNLSLKAFHIEPVYNEKEMETIAEFIGQRLAAAQDFAANYPGYFLVICQGKSCAWIIQLIVDGEMFEPDALVMLSAFMPQKNYNLQLAQHVAESEVAILDLYQANDNSWVLNNVGIRKALARKNFKVDFRQRQLHTGMNYHGQQSRTLKEIYGFITASGM